MEKSNSETSNSLPLVAVRVNGPKFYFYLVEISENILMAMQSKKSTSSATEVLSYDNNENGFDFRNTEERTQIIGMLDKICFVIKHMGISSGRRESGSKK